MSQIRLRFLLLLLVIPLGCASEGVVRVPGEGATTDASVEPDGHDDARPLDTSDVPVSDALETADTPEASDADVDDARNAGDASDPDAAPDVQPDAAGDDAADVAGHDAAVDASRLVPWCDDTPTDVDCNPEQALDPFYVDRGETRYRIPPGRALALPFTTMASTTAVGLFQYTSNYSITGWTLRTWFSTRPGGEALEDPDCDVNRAPRGNGYWTQDAGEVGDLCFLGHEARVLYANYEVVCIPDLVVEDCDPAARRRYPEDFGFDIAVQILRGPED